MDRLPNTGNLRITLSEGQSVRVGRSVRFSIVGFDRRESRSGTPYTVALVAVEAPRNVRVEREGGQS